MELLERDDDLAVLDDVLATVSQTRTGRVVVVSGEPGIGKSSLVTSFVEALGSQVRCLWGRCDDLFVPRPLGPLLDIARQAGGRWRELAERGDPAAMIEAFLDELTVGAGPTVLVIEDLQWADMATLDLVRLVTRRIGDLGALVILTHRDDIGRDHPLRRALGGLTGGQQSRVRLRPLSLPSVRRLVGELAIDPEHLHTVTGGNPFFVVESLASEGRLLPDSVREAVLARVANLTPGARFALDAASVLGVQVDRAVLEGMVGGVGDVDELVEARLLIAGDGRWRFAHDIVRQSVEDAIPPELHRQLHTRALRALGESGDLARRAHHAVGANDLLAVQSDGPRAAEAATRLGAHREAAALYGQVLRLCDRLASPDRIALLDACAAAQTRADQPVAAVATLEELVAAVEPAGDLVVLAQALGDLAGAYRFAGYGEVALATARRVVGVAEACGNPSVMTAARSRLCHQLMAVGDFAGAIEVGETVLSDGGSGADECWIVSVLNSAGCSRILSGDDRGWEMLEASLERATRAGSDVDVARALHNMHGAAVDTYRLQIAAEHYERGIEAVQRLDLGLYGCMRGTRALLLLRQGRWTEARQQVGLVLQDPDISHAQRVGPLVVLALLRARSGDPDPLEPLDEAAGLAAPFGELQLSHPVAAARAEVAWLAGDFDTLELAARELQRMSIVSPHYWYRGEASLWCHRAGIDPAAAVRLPAPYQQHLSGRFTAAAEAWTAIGCPYEAADALADSDDPDDLRLAYDQLQAQGSRPRLSMVARSLRAHGIGGLQRGPRATTLANPAALTRRESEVLTLLEQGLTNAGIASRLFVSAKTVDHHVSAILQKLGAPNRHDAVRRARELGIGRQTRAQSY